MEHEDKKKLLVVLDLDETLIHATKSKLSHEPDLVFEEYHIYNRPFLKEFLQQLHAKFRLAIWSSADDEYVHEIVKLIKPEKVTFDFVWSRSKCSIRRNIYDEYIFEKRLGKLKKKYSLEQIIIVDDTPDKSRSNFGNAIHVKEFAGSIEDVELELLLQYLFTLDSIENVRAVEKRGWRNNIND